MAPQNILSYQQNKVVGCGYSNTHESTKLHTCTCPRRQRHILWSVSVLHRSNNSFVGVSAVNLSFSLTGREIIKYSILLSRPTIKSTIDLLWVYSPSLTRKKPWVSLVNSAIFWSHWLLHKGSFSWTHIQGTHKEGSECLQKAKLKHLAVMMPWLAIVSVDVAGE